MSNPPDLISEESSQHKIAFFMDYDNMLSGGQITNETFSYLMQEFLTLGTIEHLGIYADIRYIATAGNNSYDILTQASVQGFKVIHCPKLNGSEKPKDTVDVIMASDIYDLLENRPDIDIFIFATHDRDFLPVINRAKQRRKRIILVINSPEGSKSLQQIAHQTIKLEMSVDKSPAFQIPYDLKAFLGQDFESPGHVIESIKTAELKDYRDLKIAFDLVIAIESMKPGRYGFKYYMDWLENQGNFPISHHLFDKSIIQGILSVFVGCNILTKSQDTNNRIYYALNRSHFFVQTAINQGNFERVKALFED